MFERFLRFFLGAKEADKKDSSKASDSSNIEIVLEEEIAERIKKEKVSDETLKLFLEVQTKNKQLDIEHQKLEIQKKESENRQKESHNIAQIVLFLFSMSVIALFVLAILSLQSGNNEDAKNLANSALIVVTNLATAVTSYYFGSRNNQK